MMCWRMVLQVGQDMPHFSSLFPSDRTRWFLPYAFRRNGANGNYVPKTSVRFSYLTWLVHSLSGDVMQIYLTILSRTFSYARISSRKVRYNGGSDERSPKPNTSFLHNNSFQVQLTKDPLQREGNTKQDDPNLLNGTEDAKCPTHGSFWTLQVEMLCEYFQQHPSSNAADHEIREKVWRACSLCTMKSLVVVFKEFCSRRLKFQMILRLIMDGPSISSVLAVQQILYRSWGFLLDCTRN